MAETFTKLLHSILTSSIWSEDDKTRILWITILALTEADGYCKATIPGLAAMARMTNDDVKKGITKLESKDDFSGSPEHDGRRIEKVDGGWMVLNYVKVRERCNEEERREYLRNYMQERRLKEKESASNVKDAPESCKQLVTVVNKSLTSPSISSSLSSSITKKEEKKHFTIPNLDEVTAYFKEIGYVSLADPAEFIDFYGQKGWVVGRFPMKDWRSAARNWKRNLWGKQKNVVGCPVAVRKRDPSKDFDDAVQTIVEAMERIPEGDNKGDDISRCMSGYRDKFKDIRIKKENMDVIGYALDVYKARRIAR